MTDLIDPNNIDVTRKLRSKINKNPARFVDVTAKGACPFGIFTVVANGENESLAKKEWNFRTPSPQRLMDGLRGDGNGSGNGDGYGSGSGYGGGSGD